MTTKLKDMEIQEGTICHKGKNPLAKIMLFKMDDINKETPWKKVNPDIEEVSAVLKSDSVFGKIKENLNNIWKVFTEELPDVEEYQENINKAKGALTLIEEEIEKAGKQISNANMQKIKAAMDVLRELMGNGMMEEETIEESCGEKKKSPIGKTGDDNKKNLKKGDDIIMTYEELIKELGAEKAELIKSELQKQTDSAVKEAISKAQPENEIKKQLENVKKDNEALSKALEVLRDAQLTKEFVEKAQNYKGLPVKAEDFGKVLKNLSSKDPENYAELLKVLEAADKLIVENNTLMKEIGVNETVENDAYQKLDIRAKEIQKAENVSYEVGFTKAMKENPRLYEEYTKQK